MPRSTALAPVMETYAVRLLPRGAYAERHLRRADAERYVEVYNRVMRLDPSRAELVPEPVEALDPIHAAPLGIINGDGEIDGTPQG